jgi:hypothetical protein
MGLSVLVVLFGWILASNEASGVDLMLRWMYVLLGLAVALILIMSLWGLAQNPKSAIGGLIGLVILLVIVGVSFALASDKPFTAGTKVYDNATLLKLTDTSLIAMYILMAGAVLSIIVCEARNAFK